MYVGPCIESRLGLANLSHIRTVTPCKDQTIYLKNYAHNVRLVISSSGLVLVNCVHIVKCDFPGTGPITIVRTETMNLCENKEYHRNAQIFQMLYAI